MIAADDKSVHGLIKRGVGIDVNTVRWHFHDFIDTQFGRPAADDGDRPGHAGLRRRGHHARYATVLPVDLGPGAADDERDGILDLRNRLRQEKSKAIVNGLLEWALEHRGAVLPKSKMGKAIEYMLKLWEGLTRFLEDARIPLDNNAAERALRGVVVGRKNHYGSKSKRGTEVAAIFYTLFETAKLSGVDPRAYVTTAARRAIAEHDAVTLPSDLT